MKYKMIFKMDMDERIREAFTERWESDKQMELVG